MKLLLLLIACISGPDFETAVLYLSGASTMEELDESVLDRYRTLEAHPLELNLSSRSKMLASGLMSAFQVASLIDTRERSGDILSYTELALIDGFGQQYAEALKPFLSEGELAIFRRGRNAKAHHAAPHGDLRSYSLATAVETLFGALYLKGKNDRLEELWHIAEKVFEENEGKA